MRPAAEAAFVVRSVREPGASNDAEIALAAAAVTDWARVVLLAERHRVGAYVERALIAPGGIAPPATRQAMRAVVLAHAARTALNDRLIGEVLRALSARGVPVILLKGPALARVAYPEPALRPYDDVDVLVRRDDERLAVDAIDGLGLPEVTEATPAHRLRGTHALHRTFDGHRGLTRLELHTDCLQLGIDPLCEDERWNRALPLTGLSGALMLGPEDSVVHLAVHAQKHGFARLVHLKDLDLLLRGAANLDWDLVRSVAGREGVAAPVWYALLLARDLLRTPVPAPVLRRLRPSVPTRAGYHAVTPQRRIRRLEGFTRRRLVQLVVEDSWRGMLPSLMLLGRRGHRARIVLRAVVGSG